MSWSDPIPDLTDLRICARDARAYPVQLSALENFECALDILLHGVAGENYYHRDGGNPPYDHRAPYSLPELYVREGVLQRLKTANTLLAALGYELYLFDAYRPVEVQNYFFDHWVPGKLREDHPDWGEEEILSETKKYWAKGAPSSDEVDLLSPPPHSTGGVVDLTLRSLVTRELLNMGSPFDATEEISHLDHFERVSEARILTPLEEEALINRRLLYGVMSEVGFVGNPNEWWHYGYGDQLSAILSGAPHADD